MKTQKAKIKCLALLSGGLDSILAVKILQKQGVEVTGLCFVSYFFNSKSAEKAAEQLKIKLKIVDISDEHLKMAKNPRYGYGKNMNPCVDCHLMMLRKAKEIYCRLCESRQCGFDFIATGEVLGERPMSQNKQMLKMLEDKSGLKGYLLRPLSARLFKPTIPEKEKLIDRDKLLTLSGRNRKKQIALAKKWGIKNYPTPSGGCLLTDPGFSKRLKELFNRWPNCEGNDVELLKLGRHFWIRDDKIIVGRNKGENSEIKKLFLKKDVLIEPNFPGPTILIRSKGKVLKRSMNKAEELMERYSGKK
ncbi:MAG: tRNA 4-thiouridine(8) synthase ThiI [Patescibacteria group bacterium]|nr:tRNA 4-thiouridine(8) synthase ThiI [Patescibacteria group bacterium]